jgi:alpha-glucosidase/alpha-D-xyloside xylohydrolase
MRNEPFLSRRRMFQSLGAAGAALVTGASASAAETDLRVAGKEVEIAITSVSAHTFRLTVAPIVDGKPAEFPDDGTLVQTAFGAPAARFRGAARAQTVKLGDLRVAFTPNPLAFVIETSKGEKLQHINIDKETGVISFATGSAPLLGLGEGGQGVDRRGHVDPMRSGQVSNQNYGLRTFGARVPVPWLIGSGGWAIYFHHPFGSFDTSGDESKFIPVPANRPGGRGTPPPPMPEVSTFALPIDLFFVASRDPATLMAEWARLTGRPEFPPLWSFGYQQSHRTLGALEDILAEAKLFREKKLPCDALIYLGTGFCPNGWNTRNGDFTWNARVFPDPKRSIEELHDEHMKVVLHIVVEGRRFIGTVADPCTAPPLPSGETADNQWPNDRQVSCYWPVHKPLLDLGVDGWWPDQGDGYDSASRLARIRMYYEGQQMYRPNERVYALHRNGYAGMQRYAGFLWSGDVSSLWETLRNHVPIGINCGLSGIPYWGTDIGGFVPTSEFTGELYVRWFQFAAFNTLFRSHGRVWTLHRPWGWNEGAPTGDVARETRFTIPDAEYHNATIEPICKQYLELRYRLMPYLYSAVRETTQTGLPVMRSLWFHYPDDPAAVARGDEYLWGRDMLVAPVVEKGATARTLYLPRGAWYDFWTNERQDGGREVTRPVDLATTPLYVRAGAIIPMGPVKQYTGEKVEAPLDISVYPGADGSFLHYEDDGASFSYRKGEWMGIQMAWKDASKSLTLRLAGGSKMLAPTRRDIRVKMGDASKTVVFDGHPLEVRF